MTAPIVQGADKVEARSSIEVSNSCNNCCPRLCFGRKIKKKTHLRKASDQVPIPKTESAPELSQGHILKSTRDIVRHDQAPSIIVPDKNIPTEKIKYGDMPEKTEGSK